MLLTILLINQYWCLVQCHCYSNYSFLLYDNQLMYVYYMHVVSIHYCTCYLLNYVHLLVLDFL